MIALVLALAVVTAAFIPWAIRQDRVDHAEWHLMHGPRSGCVECESK